MTYQCQRTTPSTIYQTYDICENDLYKSITLICKYMSQVILFLHKRSCWKMYPPNSTNMLHISIRNSNVVMTPFSVQPLWNFFVLDKIKKLFHDRKLLICNVAYQFKAKCIVNDFFKRVYAFSRGMACILLKSMFLTNEIFLNKKDN